MDWWRCRSAAAHKTRTVRCRWRSAPEDRAPHDWSQIANVTRGLALIPFVSGEERRHLLHPALLESWRSTTMPPEYFLNVRKGVHVGTTALAFTPTRPENTLCEIVRVSNSMVRSRATLSSENRSGDEGAIKVVDDHTVKLSLPKPDNYASYTLMQTICRHRPKGSPRDIVDNRSHRPVSPQEMVERCRRFSTLSLWEQKIPRDHICGARRGLGARSSLMGRDLYIDSVWNTFDV